MQRKNSKPPQAGKPLRLQLTCYAYFSNLHKQMDFYLYISNGSITRWPWISWTITISSSRLPQSKSSDGQINGIVKKNQGLSIHSLSAAILPEPRPPIFPKDPIADKPLKLLLPSLLKFCDLLDFLSLEELTSPMPWSASWSSWLLIFATTSRAMVLRQKGQTGGVRHAVVGFGLLWQQRAKVHCAHIWWPQSWTSIVQACSKHMQHRSESLPCIAKFSWLVLWAHWKFEECDTNWTRESR